MDRPSYRNERQRHTFANVQLSIKFDDETLASLHNVTISSKQEANATANTTDVDNERYIYAVSGLRYDDTNTDGSTIKLPCMSGNPRSRWIPRNDLESSSCTNDLQSSTNAVLKKALESSNDDNAYLRDIFLWNSREDDGCDASDEMEYAMLILTKEGCWENVHPAHMSVIDFTPYVDEHPSSNPADNSSITGFADSGILIYPDFHPMSYWEALMADNLLITPVSRYGDVMIMDDFAAVAGVNSDPVLLMSVADSLGEIMLNNQLEKNRGGGTLVCGSPNEVLPDPRLDDYFDVMHDDLDCVGCQKSYGDYYSQKQTVWVMNALEGEDQLCSRMAWALYELVNVGLTTAPDNTETNLYTYDIYKRHCFGSYFDVLKEMSYNPKVRTAFRMKYSVFALSTCSISSLLLDGRAILLCYVNCNTIPMGRWRKDGVS